jgi:hypothetical protein
MRKRFLALTTLAVVALSAGAALPASAATLLTVTVSCTNGTTTSYQIDSSLASLLPASGTGYTITTGKGKKATTITCTLTY